MSNTERRRYIRVISFLSFFSLLFGIATLVYARQADRYKLAVELSQQRAVNELCESLDSITVSLQKSIYSGTRDMLEDIGNDLCRQATVAKENLSTLTSENTETEEIFKFLSQVGDYTVALSQGDGKLLSISAEDKESLQALYEYSSALSKELTAILEDYDDGSVTFGDTLSTIDLDESQLPESFSSRMESTKQTVTDYPTLLYDGPFSDSILTKESRLLKSESEITKDEAKKIAAEIMGENVGSLREDEDVNSAIELYCFSVGNLSVSITKRGGYVCNLTSEAYAGEVTISPEEAVERGKRYLDKIGYDDMTDSYYSVYDGICTVNYAYEDDDIIHYSDLIKVSISLETGEAVALDAQGYLMNHYDRNLPEINLEEKDSEDIISDSLSILSSRLALIPLETGKEALCYEYHCKDKDSNEVLIYVNCETGKEQDIMLLLYQDGGILTR